MGYARSLVAGYALDLLPPQAAAPPVSLELRVWFNPELESRDFMIPGIVALLLLVVTTNLSAMAIVREKEVGTLEQLNVTPLARWQLIVGKLLPAMTRGGFLQAFTAKGRYERLLREIPVWIIGDSDAGLLGSADVAARLVAG